jgi:DNA-binding transcriptional regulator LsrR (DeoR family)
LWVAEWLERVTIHAKYLNSRFDSNMVMGVAWEHFDAIARHLLPKITHNTHIVQLNGAGNTRTMV